MQQIRKWVVFSDLHVTSRSVSTCRAVLEQVHAEAVARDAGILFLGDFWHERGRVPVQPLNAMIDVMADWTQPTVLVPGNHDQVDLGGLEHSLTAIAAAVPNAWCIDEPSMLGTAIVIPYRRDADEVIGAIEAHPEAVAVLCHIDVVGAFMNQAIQAGHGILPERLPTKPIYTGHYHNPHAVPGHEHIVYIGSPWQTSHSEAGQRKRFLVLDAETWAVLEEIPVDIGQRHYSCDTAKLDWPTGVRAGDRVIVNADGPEPTWFAADRERMAAWRAAGVNVDVRVRPQTASNRIDGAERMPAQELWQRFAGELDLTPNMNTLGVELLKEIATIAPEAARRYVAFDDVRMVGYGPFVDEVTYQLADRGAVLVTGRNLDMPGSDSNGSGKTTLVMAAVWALTGETDPRPDGTGLRGLGKEVINEGGKAAEVELRLRLNGEPVVVTRRMTASAHTLKISHAGEDVTQQDLKLTQALLDEMLGTSHLCRVAFHGQHELRGFLESTDKAAKDALAEIVDISIWIAAHKLAGERADLAGKAVLEVQQQHVSALELAEFAERRVGDADLQIADWTAKQQLRIDQLERDAALATANVTMQRSEAEADRSNAENQIIIAQHDVEVWKETQRSVESSARADVANAEQRHTSWRTEHDEHGTRLRERVRLLEEEHEAWKRQQQRLAAAAGAQPIDAEVQAEIDGREADLHALTAAAISPVDRSAIDAASTAVADAHRAVSLAEQRLEQIAKEGTAARVRMDAAANLPPVCGVCGQEVTEEHRHRTNADAQAETQRHRNAYSDANKQVAALRNAMTDATKVLEQARAAVVVDTQRFEADQRSKLLRERTFRDEIAEIKADWSRKCSGDVAAILRETWADSLAYQDALTQMRSWAQERNPHQDAIDSASARLREVLAQRAPDYGLERATRARDAATAKLLTLDGEISRASAAVDAAKAVTNPYTAVRDDAERRAAEAATTAEQRGGDLTTAKLNEAMAKSLSKHFSRSGVQSFVLESALSDLQQRAQGYLDELADGYLRLEINATSTTAAGGTSERISRRVMVRQSDGSYVERKIPQLSGGQRRRVIVATTMAFAEFCAARTGIETNMVVFDEVFQHLDGAGRSKIDTMLRTMPYKTILVISHDADLADEFDRVDVVTMQGDRSTVVTR